MLLYERKYNDISRAICADHHASLHENDVIKRDIRDIIKRDMRDSGLHYNGN